MGFFGSWNKNTPTYPCPLPFSVTTLNVTLRFFFFFQKKTRLHPDISEHITGPTTTTTPMATEVVVVKSVEVPDHAEKKVIAEVVMVDGIPFPALVEREDKPLTLHGHGITDVEIHFLQIKFNAIGVYFEEGVAAHLGEWKGKSEKELVGDDSFFEALVSAPVGKFLRVVVIKEIKGSQYGVQLESSVRDRLADVDKYEDEEEEALEKVTEFFQSKYLKKGSVITFSFPAASKTAEITFAAEDKEEAKLKVGNANVVEMIQKWYLGGSRAVSPTTVESLAKKFSELLSS